MIVHALRLCGLTWRSALLGFPLVLVIWIGISSHRALATYRQHLTEIGRVYLFLSGAQDLYGRLRDAETGQRGFLLTGREVYLEPYESALKSIDRDLQAMKNLAADIPGSAERLARIETLVADKRAELKETIDLYRTLGQKAAVEVVDTDRGKKIMDQVRTDLVALVKATLVRLRTQREAGYAAVRRGSLIAGVGGAVLFLLVALATFVIERDVHKQRRDAAYILELNQNLEQKVQSRTRELEESNRELESFCYSVSHDLRAPLRSVEGFAKILARDYPMRALDERGSDLIRRMSASAVRMGQLIDDLLRLSRISRSELETRTFDLSNLVQAVAEELETREPARHVEVKIEPDLVVKGDPRLLRIALDNLLGNAWKFTRDAPSPRLEFGSLVGNGEVAYYVRDNGAGFDMAHASQLFVPFQRLHRPNEFAGTGIGLATVQRVIRRHGGRIWAESAPGQGASFYFTVDIDRRGNRVQKETDSDGRG